MLRLTIAEDDRGRAAPPSAAARVEWWRNKDGQVCAYGYRSGGLPWVEIPGLASFCLASQPDEVTVFPDPSASLDWIERYFRRSMLPIALQLRGQEVLHAAAVRMRQGVVAVCGISEAGKSTIAFGLSRRGHAPWADDLLVLDASGDRVTAIPTPFQIRLRPASASFFGRDEPAPDDPLHSATGPVPLAAVFVLSRLTERHYGASIDIARLRPARALGAVLTHACCFTPQESERKQRMVQNYLKLVDRVPVFEVRFPPGLNQLEAMLDRLERAAGEA